MTRRPATPSQHAPQTPPPVYPFSAIVGQAEMKLALLLNVIAPSVGGVLIMGHRGTGKSTAVRALADLLPQMKSVEACAYNCDPAEAGELCGACRARAAAGEKLKAVRRRVPVVDLPLNATEDRVCGTISVERALREGVAAFEPGLLARAHRGFLYIDEVNLLEDHLVDLLLDVAATGRNRVEREGVSAEHAARFVLVGSGNPEEGELRPQLLDRFGLYAEIQTQADLDERVEIVTRREAFERDPAAFRAAWEPEQGRLRRRLERARRVVKETELPRRLVRRIAELCARLRTDGHRAELTIARAARALAALEGRREVTEGDVRRVAALALRHRLRRHPLEPTGGGAQIERAVSETFGAGDGDDRFTASGTGREEVREAEAQPTRQRRGGGRVSETHDEARSSVGARRAEDSAGGARNNGAGPQGDEGAGVGSGEALPAPTIDARVAIDEGVAGERSRVSSASRSGARRGAGRSTVDAPRGRYRRAAATATGATRVAFDATVRAAALSRVLRPHPFSDAPVGVRVEDVRYKRFGRKAGALYVFAVDTSGSMAANRIGQAKGALARLLRRSYVRRDRVAIVSFRERAAETVLAPSRSTTLAKLRLDALPVGGATPLAAGLVRALEVVRRARREGVKQITLLVFTDGRANVLLSGESPADKTVRERRVREEIERVGQVLRREGVTAVVVDTRSRFDAGGEGEALAAALGGRCVRLPPTTQAELRV